MKNPNHKNEEQGCTYILIQRYNSEVAGKIKENRLKCYLILPKFYIIINCCKFI